MPLRPPFRFKKFSIHQEDAPHPVGTDSVLLGAWADPAGALRMLDIGCGTGILALMMAQKSDGEFGVSITGVDIEPAACHYARENVDKSPWADRIQILENDILKCGQAFIGGFDLILSNPPYFTTDATAAPKQARRQARQMEALSVSQLMQVSAQLLAPGGRFCVILPPEQGELAKQEGAMVGLYFNRITQVHTKPGKPVERMLLAFSKNPLPIEVDRLVLFDGSDHRSPEFAGLTKSFYQD